jgi:NitT/TauT family transport system permease protein
MESLPMLSTFDTKKVYTPNSQIVSGVRNGLIAGWTGIAIAAWIILKPTVFPNPVEVLQAYPGLFEEGLIDGLIASLIVNLEALCLSAMIGLPLAYLSRVPAVQPVAQFVAKLRFVGSAVFFLPLLFLFSGGHMVKVWLIVLGQLFYLTTTMTTVVQNIPESRFDDARTLKMGEWLSVWYVVIRGTLADALDAVRDNAAMGWSMLMFVEGVIRSEGGIGVMIMNQEKHVNFAEVYALSLVILVVGIGQDWIIGQVKKVVCPYA